MLRKYNFGCIYGYEYNKYEKENFICLMMDSYFRYPILSYNFNCYYLNMWRWTILTLDNFKWKLK